MKKAIFMTLIAVLLSSCLMGPKYRTRHDENQMTTFYMPSIYSYHMIIYVGRPDTEAAPYARIKIRNFNQTNDLKFDKITLSSSAGTLDFTTDPASHAYQIGYETINSSTQMVYEEYVDLPLDDALLEKITTICNKDAVYLQLSTENEKVEYELTYEEKDRVKTMNIKYQEIKDLYY